jgi:two-component system KDP operon response regulator KdpE
MLSLLVIDDEPQVRRLIKNALSNEMRVLEAATGREGIDIAASEMPALIVLDLGLPDTLGIEVCREIRQWSRAPIIVLSAQHDATEKAAVLESGADDYMLKPFSTIEFSARVRALLRGTEAGAAPVTDVQVRLGSLTIDLQHRRVERDGDVVHLTPTEWALLRTLVSHPRETLTHKQLFTAVWGDVSGDAQQYLRVYVGHLRRKLEADPVKPRYIQTEPAVGYRFDPEPTP